MIISIKKSTFVIPEDSTKAALKSILDRYPAIKDMTLYKQRDACNYAEQLQIALFLMGYHVRVMPPGFIMDMKSVLSCALIANDFNEVMQILSKYTAPGCKLIIEIDGEPKTIDFDLLKESEIKPSIEVEEKEVVEEDQVKKRGRPKMKR